MSNSFYRTDSMEVAAYLKMKEMKYLTAEKDEHGRMHFIFQDPMGKGEEFSREYHIGEMMLFMRYFKFFRKEIDYINKKIQEESGINVKGKYR